MIEPPPSPETELDFTLDVIQTHGRLFYAYQNCLGKRSLKAGYWPAQKGWYTLALWAVTLTSIWTLPLYFNERWPLWAIFIQVAIWCALGRYCHMQQLQDDLLALGIIGERTKQPWRLHDPLLRLMWFHSHVTEREKITHNQIKLCVEFADYVTKDAPPSSTSYFRHPLTLLIIGIGVYAFNSNLALHSTVADAEKIFSHTLKLVVQAIGFGMWLHAWRYIEPERRWSFLRCLRWLELSMRP
jgi:hypothetical protein